MRISAINWIDMYVCVHTYVYTYKHICTYKSWARFVFGWRDTSTIFKCHNLCVEIEAILMLTYKIYIHVKKASKLKASLNIFYKKKINK